MDTGTAIAREGTTGTADAATTANTRIGSEAGSADTETNTATAISIRGRTEKGTAGGIRKPTEEADQSHGCSLRERAWLVQAPSLYEALLVVRGRFIRSQP